MAYPGAGLLVVSVTWPAVQYAQTVPPAKDLAVGAGGEAGEDPGLGSCVGGREPDGEAAAATASCELTAAGLSAGSR
jgi:hypothetical protein